MIMIGDTMKNKKGFTLVELLAVIVILAIIVSIAVPSTISVSKKVKKNMYCEKVKQIVTNAGLYGEDYKESFPNNVYHQNAMKCKDKENKEYTVEGGDYPGKIISLKELVEKGYMKKDNKNDVGFIIDPRDNEPLDDMKIFIYEKYGRIYTHFIEEGTYLEDAKEANQCVLTAECTPLT